LGLVTAPVRQQIHADMPSGEHCTGVNLLQGCTATSYSIAPQVLRLLSPCLGLLHWTAPVPCLTGICSTIWRFPVRLRAFTEWLGRAGGWVAHAGAMVPPVVPVPGIPAAVSSSSRAQQQGAAANRVLVLLRRSKGASWEAGTLRPLLL
jgi:hypothetical protein